MAEKKNNKTMFMALLFFLGAGALLLLSISGEDSARKPKQTQSKKYEERVNDHLMFTNQKIEIQRQRAIIDNKTYAPNYYDTKATQAYQNETNGVDLSSDGHAANVAKELGRGEREQRAPETPHELIQSELFNQQKYSEYTQAYKEDYARKFIENAARGGWKVKLNDDFKVISVTPIRNQSGQMQVFDGAGRSGQ